MSPDIEPRSDEVAFIEQTFGGLQSDEMTIPYEELDEWEIEIDASGSIQLDELLTRQENGTFRLNLSALQTSEIELRPAGNTPDSTQKSGNRSESPSLTQTSSMPPIPDRSPLQTEADRAHYDRMKNNSDSQPAAYRRLIRNEGRIKRPKFDRWCKRHNFNPSGGSHNASLLMLERIGDIERRGRGDDQIIEWTGE